MGGRIKGAGLVVACALALSCTDPRARPVPPVILIQYAPGLRVTSPGIIDHTVYAADADGLTDLDVSVTSAAAALALDTTIAPADLYQMQVSLRWHIPAGIPAGTPVRIVARIGDLAGFTAADTVVFVVQDSASTLR